MKLLFIAAIGLLTLSFVYTANPLANTKWTMEGIVIHFTAKDTVTVSGPDEMQIVAIYTVKDSLLTWRDVSTTGPSCDANVVGSYIYKIDKNTLRFTPVSDDCDGRKQELEQVVLTKQ